ncbi:MAG: hypothetical protein A2521_08840 [Deltaproteobacteria bacterium RIFOXYD12_FULL_57_12]|nr:MAG: hypothetical protein A2521_08840 [Deltaproteobacteria bacterium RIFOXYD12_FULL_57_12]
MRQEDFRRRVAEIIGEINCPKGYTCMESNFLHLCRAMDIGCETYLICFDENSASCPFSVSFAASRYCKCPLRIYLAKNLK